MALGPPHDVFDMVLSFDEKAYYTTDVTATMRVNEMTLAGSLSNHAWHEIGACCYF